MLKVSSALLLPYFAGGGHRPHWMGFGSALFSFACLLCASPHLLLPPDLSDMDFGGGGGSISVENGGGSSFYCSTGGSCSTRESNYLLFFIIFLSLLSIGFGQTAIFVLGIPYLDDNVANRDSPLYFCEEKIYPVFIIIRQIKQTELYFVILYFVSDHDWSTYPWSSHGIPVGWPLYASLHQPAVPTRRLRSLGPSLARGVVVGDASYLLLSPHHFFLHVFIPTSTVETFSSSVYEYS
jgi:hypothetical protein